MSHFVHPYFTLPWCGRHMHFTKSGADETKPFSSQVWCRRWYCLIYCVLFPLCAGITLYVSRGGSLSALCISTGAWSLMLRASAAWRGFVCHFPLLCLCKSVYLYLTLSPSHRHIRCMKNEWVHPLVRSQTVLCASSSGALFHRQMYIEGAQFRHGFVFWC